MKYESYVGIDISKDVLDFTILNQDGEVIHFQCDNEEKTIKKELTKRIKLNRLNKETTLYCAEHTGHFGKKLIRTIVEMDLLFWHESAYKIVSSQGLIRGKNDKIDSLRIAQYAMRFEDQAQFLKAESITIEKIKSLNTERDLIVVDKAKYEGQLKQEEGFLDKQYMRGKMKRSKMLIKSLATAIKEIELQIAALIKSDEELKKNFDLIVSIGGIGKQTAIATIVETGNFTRFDNPKKFVCHAGCAPFRYTSGKSIRSAHKVSKKANKDLKRLFHLAAMSCIQMKGEIRDYYLRKVEEGKSKMSVINAVRAKLITRIFAVVKQERKYENIYINSLA